MEKLRFTELGLSAEILKAVDKMGFEEASPIQTAVIPVALTGRDVVGQSATGSGKTAAFAIPAIERVDRRSKVEVLTRLIDLHDFRYGIIFCSTKLMVDELDEHLHARGYSTDRLHGDITQGQRTKVMDKFRRRGFEFLVATDVAARGLDLDDLEVVFNFDLPNDAEDYTHRIGRTGRAGKSGRAITFVSGREIYMLQSMIHYARLKIRRERVPSLDQVEEARANVFFEKLRATLEAKQFKARDGMIDRLLEQGHASTDIASALIHLMQGGAAEAEQPASAPAAIKVGRVAPNAPVKRVDNRTEESAPGPARSTPGPNPRADKPRKTKYERKPRTGREPGFTALSFNVGRAQMVTPADIVGKIAGVTRLPAAAVGAIDIHEAHSHVDVANEHVELVLKKLEGIRIKDVPMRPAVVAAEA